jgi:hypothetical protein
MSVTNSFIHPRRTRNERVSAAVRSCRGTSLAEAPVGIGLVIFGMFMAIFFIVDVFQVLVYHQKLAIAASESAEAAADAATLASVDDSFSSSINLSTIQSTTAAAASLTSQSLGLNGTTTTTSSTDGRLITVTVTGKLPLLFGVWLLPNKVAITESACAPVRIVIPNGLVTVTNSSTGNMVSFPTYSTSVVSTDFVRASSPVQFTVTLPPGASASSTLGTVIDPGWLNWSPVYPN